MGSNTIFGSSVHFIGTDLDLKWLTLRSDKGCMERLVHIRLRHGNIILESARYRLVHFMDYSESRVTVSHCLYLDTHCKYIIDLVKSLILVLHLLVDTEEVLYPSVDLSLKPCVIYMLLNIRNDPLDICFSLHKSVIDLLLKVCIYLRHKVTHGKVIQLNLNLTDT